MKIILNIKFKRTRDPLDELSSMMEHSNMAPYRMNKPALPAE